VQARLHEPASQGSGVAGRPAASKQTRHVAPAPSQGARADSRAVPKGNVWRRKKQPDGDRWESPVDGDLEARWAGCEPGPGRACYRRAKAAAAADAWRSEVAATPGVLSDGTRGRVHEERMRSLEVGVALGRREGGYKGDNPKSRPTPRGEVGGGHSSDEGVAAEPTGAKGLCLSRAFLGEGLRDCP
jgi:hypothetical protein